MKEQITSETILILKLFWYILISPITIIQIILRKKEPSELFRPIQEIIIFLFEAKFTITIVIINILIFFGLPFIFPDLLNSLILRPSDLLQFKFYTLITAGFLHANILHLLGNMLGILIFGRVVEEEFGTMKTALIYFGALIISSLFSSLIHLYILKDNTAAVGASGALMGLIATAILIKPFYLSYEFLFPMPIMVYGWLAILADITGLINPIEDGIGHYAHLAGFLSVVFLVFIFDKEERAKLNKGFVINIFSILAVLAVLKWIVL